MNEEHSFEEKLKRRRENKQVGLNYFNLHFCEVPAVNYALTIARLYHNEGFLKTIEDAIVGFINSKKKIILFENDSITFNN